MRSEPTPRRPVAAEHACLCARVAADNKARDVLVLDMRGITPLYDYFVIATGTSRRQLHTLAEEIDAALHAEGEARLGIEGYEASKWVVQDYGDIVVHLFDPDTPAVLCSGRTLGRRPADGLGAHVTLDLRLGIRVDGSPSGGRSSGELRPGGVVVPALRHSAPITLCRRSPHEPSATSSATVPRRPDRPGRRSRAVRGHGEAGPGPAARRLPGQLRHVAGQGARAQAARDRPGNRPAPGRWTTCSNRPKSPGPGFINLRLRTDWLARQVQDMAADERAGRRAGRNRRGPSCIDYSSPNVAKPMHVGHLRSTIIGDSLARLFRFLGHRVITDNHLGDWGTQFGMLLYGYKHYRDEEALQADPVRELARLYVLMRQPDEGRARTRRPKTLANPVAEAARQETAKLHAGDPENVRLWQMFMPWCLEEIDRIYRRLDVHFDHTQGESFYNPMLPEVVKSLQDRGVAQRSEGAVVIFFGADEPPALVQKRDGAFTYTTTDLATIRYRMEQWHPDAILYVVDSRQALHFKNLFDAARRWGYDRVELEHISFGSVLGPDRKPIKTREGGAVELGQLLDEAVERGLQVYEQSRADRAERGEELPELSPAERQAASRRSWASARSSTPTCRRTARPITSSAGTRCWPWTATRPTYMQYAYARIRSIFRKGDEDGTALPHRAAAAQPGTAPGAGAGLAVAAPAGGPGGSRRGIQAEPDHRLPVGPGQKLQRLLRKLPGPSRRRRRPCARAVCSCATSRRGPSSTACSSWASGPLSTCNSQANRRARRLDPAGRFD